MDSVTKGDIMGFNWDFDNEKDNVLYCCKESLRELKGCLASKFYNNLDTVLGAFREAFSNPIINPMSTCLLNPKITEGYGEVTMDFSGSENLRFEFDPKSPDYIIMKQQPRDTLLPELWISITGEKRFDPNVLACHINFLINESYPASNVEPLAPKWSSVIEDIDIQKQLKEKNATEEQQWLLLARPQIYAHANIEVYHTKWVDYTYGHDPDENAPNTVQSKFIGVNITPKDSELTIPIRCGDHRTGILDFPWLQVEFDFFGGDGRDTFWRYIKMVEENKGWFDKTTNVVYGSIYIKSDME